MDIALVSAPFSRQMPPSIPSVKLAHWYGALNNNNVKVFDLNADLFLALHFNDEAYNILHHFFGGLVYIPLTRLPSTEFYFDTNTAVPLLLTLVYAPDEVAPLVSDGAQQFGIDPSTLSLWVDTTTALIHDFAKKIAKADTIFIDMPMPGASTAGLLLSKTIKDMTDCTITACGNHINIPELAALGFSMNAYDYIAFYDDEYAVKGLLDYFEQDIPIKQVPNIAWKDSTIKRSHKVVLPKTLDGLPLPDFSCFHFPNYKIGALGARAVLLETARSCPFRCNYCSFRKFWNCLGEIIEVYRPKSIERIVNEMKAVLSVYPVNCVSFGDRTLNFNGENRFEKLLSYLKEFDLIYAGAMRTDLLTDVIIRDMSEAGFVSVVIGVESFDTACIRTYEKGSAKYVKNAVDVAVSLLDHGIMPHINILVGHPHETGEDTIRALKRLEKVTEHIKGEGHPVFGLNASVFHFNYPSKMYKEFLESDNYYTVYHDITLKNVPEAVKKAASKIPVKAVKRGDSSVDKCAISDKIYTFWSDDEEIIAYTLKILEKYYEPLFDAWLYENVRLEWHGSLQLEEVTTEPERVVKTIINANTIHLDQLMKALGYTGAIPKEVKKMVWAVIFMLYMKRVLNVLPQRTT